MAQKQVSNTEDNVLASVIASGGLGQTLGSGTGAATVSAADAATELQNLQLQKARLELAKLQKELADQGTREKELEVFKASTTASVNANRRNTEALQAACQHRKENGSTHLAGQRMQNGKTVLICQGCFKIFNGTQEVPPGLMPPGHMVGGPLVIG